MPTVLITGANRGLGLEYTRQYSQLGWDVIACTRKPDASELAALAQDKLQIHNLDVVDHKAVDDVAAAVGDIAHKLAIANSPGISGSGAKGVLRSSAQ